MVPRYRKIETPVTILAGKLLDSTWEEKIVTFAAPPSDVSITAAPRVTNIDPSIYQKLFRPVNFDLDAESFNFWQRYCVS